MDSKAFDYRRLVIVYRRANMNGENATKLKSMLVVAVPLQGQIQTFYFLSLNSYKLALKELSIIAR